MHGSGSYFDRKQQASYGGRFGPRDGSVRLYGYRSNEVDIARAAAVKQGFKCTLNSVDLLRDRRVASVSLGPHLLCGVVPKWDLAHATTCGTSATKRIGTRLPQLARNCISKIRSFALGILSDNFGIPDVSVDDFDTWLSTRDYSTARKTQISEAVVEDAGRLDLHALSRVMSFIKDEMVDQSFDFGSAEEAVLKAARTINGRSDLAKGAFGPIAAAVDKFVFANPHFIKKIPIHERPGTIDGRLRGAGRHYFVIDYTSFECSFGAEWMEAVEETLLLWVIQQDPVLNDMVERVIGPTVRGKQRLVHWLYKVIIQATRMSGEMFTSNCNGFSNMVLVELLFGRHLIDYFIEGDDNVGCTDVEIDVSAAALKMGFRIKVDWVERPGDAGFCGLYYDENGNVIRDAVPTIAKFGWTSAIYDGASENLRRRLIRSKALSLAYENPSCPVLWKFAQKFLALTEGCSLGKIASGHHLNQYDRQRLKWALEFGPSIKEPDVAGRMYYERIFGMSVADQLLIERDIDRISGLSVMTLPNLLVPDSYAEFYYTYVSSCAFPYMSYFASKFYNRDTDRADH